MDSVLVKRIPTNKIKKSPNTFDQENDNIQEKPILSNKSGQKKLIKLPLTSLQQEIQEPIKIVKKLPTQLKKLSLEKAEQEEEEEVSQATDIKRKLSNQPRKLLLEEAEQEEEEEVFQPTDIKRKLSNQPKKLSLEEAEQEEEEEEVSQPTDVKRKLSNQPRKLLLEEAEQEEVEVSESKEEEEEVSQPTDIKRKLSNQPRKLLLEEEGEKKVSESRDIIRKSPNRSKKLLLEEEGEKKVSESRDIIRKSPDRSKKLLLEEEGEEEVSQPTDIIRKSPDRSKKLLLEEGEEEVSQPTDTIRKSPDRSKKLLLEEEGEEEDINQDIISTNEKINTVMSSASGIDDKNLQKRSIDRIQPSNGSRSLYQPRTMDDLERIRIAEAKGLKSQERESIKPLDKLIKRVDELDNIIEPKQENSISKDEGKISNKSSISDMLSNIVEDMKKTQTPKKVEEDMRSIETPRKVEEDMRNIETPKKVEEDMKKPQTPKKVEEDMIDAKTRIETEMKKIMEEKTTSNCEIVNINISECITPNNMFMMSDMKMLAAEEKFLDHFSDDQLNRIGLDRNIPDVVIYPRQRKIEMILSDPNRLNYNIRDFGNVNLIRVDDSNPNLNDMTVGDLLYLCVKGNIPVKMLPDRFNVRRILVALILYQRKRSDLIQYSDLTDDDLRTIVYLIQVCKDIDYSWILNRCDLEKVIDTGMFPQFNNDFLTRWKRYEILKILPHEFLQSLSLQLPSSELAMVPTENYMIARMIDLSENPFEAIYARDRGCDIETLKMKYGIVVPRTWDVLNYLGLSGIFYPLKPLEESFSMDKLLTIGTKDGRREYLNKFPDTILFSQVKIYVPYNSRPELIENMLNLFDATENNYFTSLIPNFSARSCNSHSPDFGHTRQSFG